jgi:hypothetical protein
MNRRQFMTTLLPGVTVVAVASPTLAQDMGERGVPIPSFFFSRQERLAREACENKSPNCRSSVRDQMALEREISLLLPWAGLGVGLVLLLTYMRKKEQEKEKRRRMAQRNHVPGAFKTLDQDRPESEDRDSRDRDRF